MASRRPTAPDYIPLLIAALTFWFGCDGERRGTDGTDRTGANEIGSASVSIGAIHHPETNDAGQSAPPYRVTLDDGERLEIRDAYIVVAAVELHACEPESDDYESGGGPMLNDLGDLLVPPVEAHVPSASNRFGTPYVEHLTGSFDRARIVGELSAPLAVYCRLAVVVAPADRDVANSTPLRTDTIRGHSALVRGRRRPAEDASWESFQWTTDTAEVFEIPARDPRSGESPLVLSSSKDDVMLLIDKTVGPETFAIDPESEDPAASVVTRVGATLQVYTY